MGALAGNPLTFGHGAVTTLEIDGDRMRGPITGQVDRVLKLTKRS